jgi:hypothetical protein
METTTLFENVVFVDEELSFSTRDLEMIEFYGRANEYFSEGVKQEEQPIQLRLIGNELFSISNGQAPPKSIPLTKNAGIFRIIGVGGEA